jgi:hypothetical protein
MKYKVGDKVRIISNDKYFNHCRKLEYIVIVVCETGLVGHPISIRSIKGYSIRHVTEDEIELCFIDFSVDL